MRDFNVDDAYLCAPDPPSREEKLYQSWFEQISALPDNPHNPCSHLCNYTNDREHRVDTCKFQHKYSDIVVPEQHIMYDGKEKFTIEIADTCCRQSSQRIFTIPITKLYKTKMVRFVLEKRKLLPTFKFTGHLCHTWIFTKGKCSFWDNCAMAHVDIRELEKFTKQIYCTYSRCPFGNTKSCGCPYAHNSTDYKVPNDLKTSAFPKTSDMISIEVSKGQSFQIEKRYIANTCFSRNALVQKNYCSNVNCVSSKCLSVHLLQAAWDGDKVPQFVTRHSYIKYTKHNFVPISKVPPITNAWSSGRIIKALSASESIATSCEGQRLPETKADSTELAATKEEEAPTSMSPTSVVIVSSQLTKGMEIIKSAEESTSPTSITATKTVVTKEEGSRPPTKPSKASPSTKISKTLTATETRSEGPVLTETNVDHTAVETKIAAEANKEIIAALPSQVTAEATAKAKIESIRSAARKTAASVTKPQVTVGSPATKEAVAPPTIAIGSTSETSVKTAILPTTVVTKPATLVTPIRSTSPTLTTGILPTKAKKVVTFAMPATGSPSTKICQPTTGTVSPTSVIATKATVTESTVAKEVVTISTSSNAEVIHICTNPRCGKPAKLLCPTCIKLSIQPSRFCDQQCFKSCWEEHKRVHVAVKNASANPAINAIKTTETVTSKMPAGFPKTQTQVIVSPAAESTSPTSVATAVVSPKKPVVNPQVAQRSPAAKEVVASPSRTSPPPQCWTEHKAVQEAVSKESVVVANATKAVTLTSPANGSPTTALTKPQVTVGSPATKEAVAPPSFAMGSTSQTSVKTAILSTTVVTKPPATQSPVTNEAIAPIRSTSSTSITTAVSPAKPVVKPQVAAESPAIKEVLTPIGSTSPTSVTTAVSELSPITPTKAVPTSSSPKVPLSATESAFPISAVTMKTSAPDVSIREYSMMDTPLIDSSTKAAELSSRSYSIWSASSIHDGVKCPVCMVKNKKDATICVSCESPCTDKTKTNTVTAAPASKPNNNATAPGDISSSGYVFPQFGAKPVESETKLATTEGFIFRNTVPERVVKSTKTGFKNKKTSKSNDKPFSVGVDSAPKPQGGITFGATGTATTNEASSTVSGFKFGTSSTNNDNIHTNSTVSTTAKVDLSANKPFFSTTPASSFSLGTSDVKGSENKPFFTVVSNTMNFGSSTIVASNRPTAVAPPKRDLNEKNLQEDILSAIKDSASLLTAEFYYTSLDDVLSNVFSFANNQLKFVKNSLKVDKDSLDWKENLNVESLSRWSTAYDVWMKSDQFRYSNSTAVRRKYAFHPSLRLGTNGNRANVYLGICTEDCREVAIKILHPTRIAHENVESHEKSTQREWIQFNKIHRGTPGFVSYVGSWSEQSEKDGDVEITRYVVSELMEGSLDELLVETSNWYKNPFEQLVGCQHVLSSILSILKEWHNAPASKQLIHCDIKPSNILVDTQRRIRLIDSGISKADVLGIHPTSDLYSLGLVFYQMLRIHRWSRTSFPNLNCDLAPPSSWPEYRRYAATQLLGYLLNLDSAGQRLGQYAEQTKGCGSSPYDIHKLLLAHPFFWSSRKYLAFLVSLANSGQTLPNLSSIVESSIKTKVSESPSIIFGSQDEEQEKENWFMMLPIDHKKYMHIFTPEDQRNGCKLLHFIRVAVTRIFDDKDPWHQLLKEPIFLKLFPTLVCDCWFSMVQNITVVGEHPLLREFLLPAPLSASSHVDCGSWAM